MSGVVPQSEPAARDTAGGRQETSANDGPDDQAAVSTRAHEFLRQALGSNDPDMRLPSLVFSLALLLAVLVRFLRRRRRREETSQREGP